MCELSFMYFFPAPWSLAGFVSMDRVSIHISNIFFLSPVVLIMLLGVAVAAAKMLGVLPGVADPLVVGVPTVLTDRLPGGGFFTGTTTLL